MKDNRRLKLVVVGLAVVFSLILVRLVDLVLVKGEAYLRLATANRFYTQKITPERGLILDQAGKRLAFNLPVYFYLNQPEALFPTTRRISRLEALSLLATDSAHVKETSYRYYPLKQALAQTVGFVRPVTADDLKQKTNLKLDDVVGQMGLEKVFDQSLRGEAGRKVWEVDALGRKKRLVQEVKPKPGANLHTTLVADLNQVVYEKLKDKKGAVVVLDAQTGAVLALVSTPSFDPNLLTHRFAEPETEKARQASVSAWLKDPAKPFFNRATGGTYPPGSTFKLVTALAGLESSKLDPEKTVNDTGVLKVGDYEYANWYYSQYGRTEGSISLIRAIARSNDIYFYKAAEWTGPDVIASLARRLGLGSALGIELPAEASGLVPDPAYKAERFNQRWYLGNTYHFGIGQGDTLVTPLQLAGMTQTIAAFGKRCKPHLVKQPKNSCTDLGLKPENVGLVLEGMIQACLPGGTAFPFFKYNQARLATLDESASIKERLKAGVAACKTGTAEFGPVRNESGARATHGWFVIYLDLTGQKLNSTLSKLNDFSSQVVVTVLVESDETNPFKEGSADAASVAKEIVEWMVGNS